MARGGKEGPAAPRQTCRFHRRCLGLRCSVVEEEDRRRRWWWRELGGTHPSVRERGARGTSDRTGSSSRQSHVIMVHHHHRRRGLQASHHCTVRRRGATPSLLQVFLLILGLWLPILDNGALVLACGPGRGGGRRPGLSNMCPTLARTRCLLADSARDVFPDTTPDSEISCLTTTPTSSSRTRRVQERID